MSNWAGHPLQSERQQLDGQDVLQQQLANQGQMLGQNMQLGPACTAEERAFLDAVYSGQPVHEARMAMLIARITPELRHRLIRSRAEANRAHHQHGLALDEVRKLGVEECGHTKAAREFFDGVEAAARELAGVPKE